MTDRLAVVVNKGGGAASKAGDELQGQIEQAFAAAGVTAEIHAVEGCDIVETVARLAKSGAVAVGGGDGTIGCAAESIAAAGATLGLLPLGTRNHLARQLGIPMELAEAAKVIAGGHAEKIDLSTVNDATFVNNVSIGLYPEMVRERDANSLPKWLANFPAAWTTLKRARHHRLRVTMDGASEVIRTPMLFVGNNIYSLDAGKVGERQTLDDGQLSVFAVARRGRLGLIGFALRALTGRADPEADFAALGVTKRLRVDAHARSIEVAIDGELKRLTTPLEFGVRPGALSVFTPLAA